MKHQLFLHIPVTSNTKILRLEDASIYTTALPVECARLEITVPGYVNPAPLEVNPAFRVNASSCTLQLPHPGCPDQIQCLPDGLYVIRYSVSPNDKVFVEYNHLRITDTLNLYYSKLAKVNLGDCQPGPELKEILRQFHYIRTLLDAARAKIEVLHESNRGMEIFQYARRLLEKLQYCHFCK